MSEVLKTENQLSFLPLTSADAIAPKVFKCMITSFRAVMVFETKTTVFFPKLTGTEATVFRHQMNGFLSLDNSQDLQLRPNWDRCNNNDERACLSAPMFCLRTKMK